MKELVLMSTISTIIPVYQDSGLPFEILKQSLKSILQQTHAPIEIILSDDTSGNGVKDWVEQFNMENSSSVIYVRNSGAKGVSSNSNFAARFASATFLHFLHSDDRLIDCQTYAKAIKYIEEFSCSWLLLGGQMNGVVTFPRMAELNLFGVNTVGGPSGLVIKKAIFDGFDEHVSLLMDIELFLRTANNYGPPQVVNEICIQYGSGDWQLTKTIDESKYFSEINYLWKNRALSLKDFVNLMKVNDSWEIKQRAYAFVITDSKLKSRKKIVAAIHFKFANVKYRIKTLKESMGRRLFR